MTERVRHIEMTWRCSACGERNLGRHKTCQSCANPKDGSEQWEMPEDPSKAASVTDEDLLRMATAGPDWRCAYCGSDQRRAEGSCANCGASAVEGAETPEDAPLPLVKPAAPVKKKGGGKLLAGVAVVAAVGGGFYWNAQRPRDYEGKVSAVSWEQVKEVERWAIRGHEGFAENVPAGAFERSSIGQKVHHHEQVLDGYDTVAYTVEVPDGYRTESYSARVACGEDCSESPRSCHETCTTNRNGFATCREVCSGGYRRCTTRYCSETRTRQVAKTRTEPRTKQVPRYRQEPRYAEAFRWKVWEWALDRTVHAEGTDVATLKWPEGGARKEGAAGLGQGEKERETRHGKYSVTLVYDGDQRLAFDVPTADELARFATGTTHKIHEEAGRFSVDGAAVTPL